jgi:hypothetical protein
LAGPDVIANPKPHIVTATALPCRKNSHCQRVVGLAAMLILRREQKNQTQESPLTAACSGF